MQREEDRCRHKTTPSWSTYHGREHVLRFLARTVQIALPEFEMHDIVASDEHVVALTTVRWRRNDNGETFEDRIGQVFHLDGGQVLEAWTMGEDLAGFDQFLEGVSD
jgi:ketosteroid isomerase-like protein